MKIKELKERILSKTLNDDLLILKYVDFQIIPNQYIKSIAQFKNLPIKYVDSLIECNENGLFEQEPSLNVLITSKLSYKDYKSKVEEFNEFLSTLKNTIIVCNSVEKDITLEYTTEIPKLEDWQLIAHMKSQCDGLGERELAWLCEVANSDAYRLENEISKIKIFDKQFQVDVFNSINEDNGYSDLSNQTIYTLANAIMSNNKSAIKCVLESLDSIDIEGVGLVTILYNKTYNILNIKSNPKATPSSLGISDKQFGYIKRYECKTYSDTKLRNMLKFLMGIDYKLKMGYLPMTSKELAKYVIYGIISA